ncbi:secondary thiamine-phosphate synthase enzyme YjbQ [Salinimicrobium sediminilitoris]|uniref:secondary thiamine-phosphate synthase enzyme YjbQ n=1 Tax=Salinimicrobium sediminilitoris TaxID=2876715 RepID=UPI001E2AEE0F|nr:secondary thiamine-phosphate synthase enzyme YjbQ [Salinimicrobium sediminilitoris]MCC8358609.1 secondary thiamine-phosphate synthase enzyme YjbQ [Salinimicrobium sediminilitoris]
MAKLDYIFQKEIKLSAKTRGFHLVTEEVTQQIPEIKEVSMGFLQIFIKHTSAGLSINENADPTVREDLESHFNEMVPEDQPYYKHTFEGSDDMPAHIKAALLGSSLQIPVTNGQLNLGTWQGIYLCEHRDHGGSRKLVLTVYGEKK